MMREDFGRVVADQMKTVSADRFCRAAVVLLVAIGLVGVKSPAHSQDQLVPLVQPGPWPGVSGLIAYGNRLWLVNSVKFVNHNSADVYSYDPSTDTARYEQHLFSQDAGDPVVADGLLYWPFEDSRMSLGRGEFMVTNGSTWRWHMLPQGLTFHVHAMAALDGKLFAATSAWRGGLQVSGDQGRSWRVAYDHPTPDGFVSRFTTLTAHDGTLYAGLTAWREDGPRLFRYEGDTLVQAPGFPEGRAVPRMMSFGGDLYATLTGGGGSALWRYDGKTAKPVEGLTGYWVRDMAVGDDLWAITVEGGGGILWRSGDGRNWQQVQQFPDGAPLDVELYAGSVYVGTEGPGDRGTLWGPPSSASVETAFTPAADVPRPEPPMKTGTAREDLLATLDAALIQPKTYERHAGALRAALLPLFDRADAQIGRELSKRLDAAFPDTEVGLIGGRVMISAATLARWNLLWAIAQIGHGRMPLSYLAETWTTESNRAEKYFDLPPLAAWTIARLGQSNDETVEALITRLERDEDPLWLKGDIVGALSVVTGQQFGYEPVAWRQWWEARSDG